MTPADEARFETVTYTYYEQLNGYEHLKSLDIGYFFYSGSYLDAIMKVLDPALKTIVHIPNVNSRESTKDKIKEVDEIMNALGVWEGEDPVTGFHLIRRPDASLLKIANLVDDEPGKRDRVVTALKDPAHKNDRAHVDIIIALGMAKEGFDWIWCEHALTVGYRSSLTEIIQIIGRATRDAPDKTSTRFTNLIAEPDAAEDLVVDAINDTLKAIAASLLMEQVLAPRFNFTPKDNGAIEGFDYGEGGYKDVTSNVGFSQSTGQIHMEIKGLVTPQSHEAKRVCQEDINEVITAFVQDKVALERGLFDSETVPEELTQLRMGKIVKDRYPELSDTDQEAVRQHAIAALSLIQTAKTFSAKDDQPGANMALIEGVRKYALEVKDLDIDLIDRINPFQTAYAILSKSMNEKTLKQVAATIEGRRIVMTEEEARDMARRALKFKREHGRVPEITAADPWEKRMAEGVALLARLVANSPNG